MTTGWAGDDRDPAPAIAYDLAAAVADGDETLAAATWKGVAARARAGVLAALGAQARHAAGDAGAAREQLMMAVIGDVTAALRHCDLRAAALTAISGMTVPAAVPACDGCPRAAVALARARVTILQRGGLPAGMIAEVSRRAAARARQ